ncbi:MAG: hypothetical protein Q4F72_05335 [Desulfovibrionaceae bacterium]|nr:hypothetical protein [Desulfovibrionaceae bacterium]
MFAYSCQELLGTLIVLAIILVFLGIPAFVLRKLLAVIPRAWRSRAGGGAARGSAVDNGEKNVGPAA